MSIDLLFKLSYKNHINDLLARDGRTIKSGERLPCDILLFLVQETKKYHVRVRSRFSTFMETSDEMINGIAIHALLAYLKDLNIDLEDANSKQRTVEGGSPTVLDFITTLISQTGAPPVYSEEDVEAESPSVASPSETKSNTGTSGKFQRFMRTKKKIDEKAVSGSDKAPASDKALAGDKALANEKLPL